MHIKLAILSAMAILFCIVLNGKIYEKKESNKEINKNSQAINVVQAFREDMDQGTERYYAGTWLDEENVPHIAYTKKLDKNFEEDAEKKGIVIEFYEHTYEELIFFQNSIHDVTNHSGLIVSSNISESSNAIEIGYKSDDDLILIKDMIELVNLNDIPIQYVLDTSEYISTKGVYFE